MCKLDEEIIINGKLEFNDLLKYSYWFYYQSLKGKISIIVSSLIIAFSIYLITNSKMLGVDMKTIAIELIIAIIYILFFPLSVYLMAKKHWKTTMLYGEEQKYIFNSEGIKQISKSATTSIKWDALYKVVELNYAFSLSVSNNKGVAIPKRFFTNSTEIEILKVLIKEKVNLSKVKLKS